ncbi:Metallo-hydrolase/oxidoreductase [Violaceomyces palustris]|uniref:Metallo-hydrolase/oxidoreductase n=1 Tax=Violaceomyces palustris TaxID=1673888 RepID=A0ACD0NSP9_9BASI|nr:Metallo-hydrolase/oxidoreductase [Violaceomyces palustris]
MSSSPPSPSSTPSPPSDKTSSKGKITTSSRKSVSPPFYKTSPAPHWKSPNSNTSGGFKSPWPSSQSHGFLQFLRARLFDWDEVPLPTAGFSSSDPNRSHEGLPVVRKDIWSASADQTDKASSTAGEDRDKIRFTWLGHASCHFQLPVPPLSSQSSEKSPSVTILCDPVLSRRCSPFSFIGPERFTQAPTTITEMANAPEVGGRRVWPDFVCLSHNHYDHLDYDTIKELISPRHSRPKPHILCPLGVKAWFKSNFGLRDDEVTESDWWDQTVFDLGDGESRLRVTCTPAQHFTGRGIHDRNKTLWAGWVFETLRGGEEVVVEVKGAKVWFAGDTGYRSVGRGMSAEEEDSLPTCPAFREIGEVLGPLDLSAIPIGAYLPRNVMSTVHMSPRDSVRVHGEVRSRKSVGIHWGSFRLTPEDVNEPPRLLKEECEKLGIEKGEFDVVEIGETISVVAAGAGGAGDEALPESKLGTKAHWDSVYEREVTNFEEIGEEGEVWFGEDSVDRMVRYLEEELCSSDGGEQARSAPHILDLGTGNGHLLFSLLESEELGSWLEAGRMKGVDYSEASVKLARAVGRKRAEEEEGCKIEEIKFETLDLMETEEVSSLKGQANEGRGWDVVLDKGTFDAIALSSKPIEGKLPVDLYTIAVRELVKRPEEEGGEGGGGIFLITSCNFTEEELKLRFEKSGFKTEHVIPTPSFSFGGSKGSTTTSIAFRRV